MVPLTADEVFLFALDLDRGTPRWPSRTEGVVLAGALLTELVLAGAVEVGGGVVRLTGGGATSDRLQAVLVERTGQLSGSGSIRLAEWLATFAPGTVDVVGDRLVAQGVLQRGVKRRFGSSSVRWRPVEPAQALMVSQRAMAHVHTGVGVSAQSVLVVALVMLGEPDPSALGLPAPAMRLLQDPRGVLSPDLLQVLGGIRDALHAAIAAPR